MSDKCLSYHVHLEQYAYHNIPHKDVKIGVWREVHGNYMKMGAIETGVHQYVGECI